MLVDNSNPASLLKTLKPMTTETGNSGISGYRYRYRTFSQNALPQGVGWEW